MWNLLAYLAEPSSCKHKPPGQKFVEITSLSQPELSDTTREREKEGRWGEKGREGEEEESGKEGGTNFPVINNIGGWSDRVEEGPEGRWRLWWW